MFQLSELPRKWGLASAFALQLVLAHLAFSTETAAGPAIIPQPRHIAMLPGHAGFQLGCGIPVDSSTSSSKLGRAAIRALMAAGIPVAPEEPESKLRIEHADTLPPEGYRLVVTPQEIRLQVADEHALAAASQTIAQAITTRDGNQYVPAMQVEDFPWLQHRGLMLDPSRHPISVEDTKRILRIMARYKLNRLHWHLCDDQGWRMEIRKYPRLTEIGSKRTESSDWQHQSIKDGTPVEFFYTQDDIRDIVACAHSLGITIIPEIEIPGHASAAVAAYPELGNQDSPDFAPRVITGWGVFPHVMAPNDFSFRFIEDVLTEVCELFPRAPYIHIGGDEVPQDQWKSSPAAQAFMQNHGMKKEGEIQDYFTHYCAAVLRTLGRGMVGWDEIMCAPQLPQEAVIMAWRGMEHARIAASRGHKVILCPIQAFYFNFPQGKTPQNPFYTGLSGFDNINWQHVLAFDTSIPGDQVIGLQANLWSECIPDMRKLEFMLVPRICALAEASWLPREQRPGEQHLGERIRQHYEWFDSQRINFRQENGVPRLFPDARK